MTQPPKSDYNEYPRTLPRDDLWGQVRRTINGRRISEQEIGVIVEAIRRGLTLQTDALLDLACGNGALTERLFAGCRLVVGVDASSYLIEIARERFERPPDRVFVERDIVEYLRSEPDPERFTKAMCYASIQFLAVDRLEAMLETLAIRFTKVERILLGNVPDRTRATRFLADNPQIASLDLDDPTAQAGRWWTPDALAKLAARSGWPNVAIERLPPEVFNAPYRYDAILARC